MNTLSPGPPLPGPSTKGKFPTILGLHLRTVTLDELLVLWRLSLSSAALNVAIRPAALGRGVSCSAFGCVCLPVEVSHPGPPHGDCSGLPVLSTPTLARRPLS